MRVRSGGRRGRTTQAWTTALLASVVVLAGCLAAVDGGPGGQAPATDGSDGDPHALLDTVDPVRHPDPAGDATDWGTGDADTWLGLPFDLPSVGTPAPHFDILSVAVAGETADALVLQMEVASLAEGFPGVQSPDGTFRLASYAVCWAPTTDDGCDLHATLQVMAHGGTAHHEAVFETRALDCNEWPWCAWGVPVEVAFGEPATITFRVPKAYVAALDVPLTVDRAEGSVTTFAESSDVPHWHPGVTAHTPAYHFHTHGGSPGVPSVNDATDAFAVGAELAPSDAVPAPPSDEPLLMGGEGLTHGHDGRFDHPEMDLLWFDLFEDDADGDGAPEDLVAVFAVKAWHGLPDYDFDHSVAVGIGAEVWEVGYRHEGGEAYGYAGRCVMEPCDDPVNLEPEVEIVEGEPAFLKVRWPLDAVSEAGRDDGAVTNLFWAMTMVSDANHYFGDHTDEDGLYGDVHSVYMVDSLVGGTPYVFGSDHRATLEAHDGHEAGHRHG